MADSPPGAQVGQQRAFFADGAALGASAVITALIGLLGWLLAANLLDPAEVGHASAFVNAFVLVAALAELGLGQAGLKWLPQTGTHTAMVVARIYGIVLGSALVLSVVWGLVTAGALSRQLSLAAPAAVGVFVLACLAWSMFHVQDFVLTGLGVARWVPVENISFGVARIVLLVALASQFGALGIVLSWMVPTLLAVIVVAAALLRHRRRRDGLPGTMPARQEAARLAGSTWLSTVGGTLMNNLVPLIVTTRFGAATGAVFFVVWNGVAALDLAASGFGSALVVRLQGTSMHLLRSALTTVLPLFAVPLAIAAAAAAPLLHLFGPLYAEEGELLLRWVCLGVVFRLVAVMVVAIHLSAGRLVRMVALQGGTAGVVILLVSVIDTSVSLSDIGLVYAVVQGVLAALAVLDLAIGSRAEAPHATA